MGELGGLVCASGEEVVAATVVGGVVAAAVASAAAAAAVSIYNSRRVWWTWASIFFKHDFLGMKISSSSRRSRSAVDQVAEPHDLVGVVGVSVVGVSVALLRPSSSSIVECARFKFAKLNVVVAAIAGMSSGNRPMTDIDDAGWC